MSEMIFRELCRHTVDSAPGRYVALNRTVLVKVKIIDLEKKKARAVFRNSSCLDCVVSGWGKPKAEPVFVRDRASVR